MYDDFLPTNKSLVSYDPADFPLPLAEPFYPSYYKDYVTWPQLYLELAIIIDHSYYLKHGSNKTTIYRRIKDLTKIVNYHYEPLRVKIALVDLEIWEHRDNIPMTNNRTVLTKILWKYNIEWHKTRLKKYDIILLMSNLQFIINATFEANGFATVAGMCRYNRSAIVVTEFQNRSVYHMADIMTHEIGHLFYMKHDETVAYCHCHDGQTCFMHDAVDFGHVNRLVHWSNCSLAKMAKGFFLSGLLECLKNKPEHVYSDDQIDYHSCGDGFVDRNEECDCPSVTIYPLGCRHTCCDPSTCRLSTGSRCADGQCCNMTTCQLQPTLHICRPATDECDLVEYCNGSSSECPLDIYKHDGLPCKSGTSRCYNGQCGFLDRCKFLFNHSMEEANPACYSLNEYGNKTGNCGYFKNVTFVKCLPSDVKCGLLQCADKVNDIPDKQMLEKQFKEFGNVTTISSRPDIKCAQIHSQFTPSYGHRLEYDYIPDGTSCADVAGQRKVCYKYKCLDIQEVLALNSCAPNCTRNGVCSNVGTCICNRGFIGISCEIVETTTKLTTTTTVEMMPRTTAGSTTRTMKNITSEAQIPYDHQNWEILAIIIVTVLLFIFSALVTTLCIILKKHRKKVKHKVEKGRKQKLKGVKTVLSAKVVQDTDSARKASVQARKVKQQQLKHKVDCH